ncbi:MAG: putative toxin-antitoxin system toxin component, PIN family [Pseudomonadota bacterium]
MTTPKQVVIDTNVCLDLFVFNDPRWAKLLSGLKDGSIKALTREDCRQEWLAVLHYPHLPIDDISRDQIIIAFDEFISCVSPVQKNIQLPRCSDKDDQKFMEIASDAGVETLITKDKALLKLARKTRQAGYFSIATPEQFLANLAIRNVEV